MSRIVTQSDYTSALVSQRNDLADNIDAKGVEAERTEKLNTLVPKVLEIPSGSTMVYRQWFIREPGINISYSQGGGSTTSSLTLSTNTSGWAGTAVIIVRSPQFRAQGTFSVEGFEYIGDIAGTSAGAIYAKTYPLGASIPSQISVTLSFEDGQSYWLQAAIMYIICGQDVEIGDKYAVTGVNTVTYTPASIDFDDQFSAYWVETYWNSTNVTGYNDSYTSATTSGWFDLVWEKRLTNYHADPLTMTLTYSGSNTGYFRFTQIKFKSMLPKTMKSYRFGLSSNTFWESLKNYLLPNVGEYAIENDVITLSNNGTPYVSFTKGSEQRLTITAYGSSSTFTASPYVLGMWLLDSGNILFQFSTDNPPTYTSYLDAFIAKTESGKRVFGFNSGVDITNDNFVTFYIADGVYDYSKYPLYLTYTLNTRWIQLTHPQINGSDDTFDENTGYCVSNPAGNRQQYVTLQDSDDVYFSFRNFFFKV